MLKVNANCADCQNANTQAVFNSVQTNITHLTDHFHETGSDIDKKGFRVTSCHHKGNFQHSL